jgi:hypothetical protein
MGMDTSLPSFLAIARVQQVPIKPGQLAHQLAEPAPLHLTSNWNRILEAFNGQYFFNLSEQKSQTGSANEPIWKAAA